MKVLLINPPRENVIHMEGPPETIEEIGFFAPLGLLYIAAALRKNSDFEIRVCDAHAEGLQYSGLASLIGKFSPDVVGITSMTASLIDVIKTAKLIKDINKEIHVCVGGPHVFIFPKETLNLDNIDSIVIGEGEKAFAELVSRISKNQSLDGVAGAGYKDKNGRINIFRPFGFIPDLNTLAFPARDLIEVNRYFNIAGKKKAVATLMSSRGCPGRCTFCATIYKKPRYLSASRVVEEMSQCQQLGVEEIFFLDDTFNLDMQRVNDICGEIARRRLKIDWGIKARIDFVTEELLKNVVMAGCSRIHFGIESGTEEGLRRLKKDITLEQVRRVFTWANKYNIETSAAFIIGSPGENRTDILKTIKFAKELSPTFAQFSILTPYPRTELYKEGLRRGIWKSDFWEEFSRNPSPDFKPKLWEEILSGDELYELAKFAYKDFYLRPGYIIKSFIKIKSIEEFKRKASEGLKIMRF